MKWQEKKALLQREFGKVSITRGSIFRAANRFPSSPDRDPSAPSSGFDQGYRACFANENVTVSMLESELVPEGQGVSEAAAVNNLFNTLQSSPVIVHRGSSARVFLWEQKSKNFKPVKN
jgi:hypothetical protein